MAANTSVLQNSNPAVNEQLMTAQQQLALAQALRGQSLQPLQAPGGQNGVISPLSALAQALNGYTASTKMQDATHNLASAQAAQANNQFNMMGAIADRVSKAMGGDASSDSPAPQQPPVAPPAPAQAPPAAEQAPGQPSISDIASGNAPPYNPASASLIAMLRSGGQSGGTGALAAASPPSAVQAPASSQALASALQGGSASPAPQQGNAQGPSAGNILGAGTLADMLGMSGLAKAAYDRAGQLYGRNLDRTMPAPTDIEKQLISQGVQRGSPAWNQALAGAVSKANYIAPVQVAQGNVVLDPATNKPVLQNPKMADGMSADFTDPLAPTASAVPGYAQGNATNVAAAETAKADSAIRDVTLPSGATVPVRAGPAAAAGGAQAGVGGTWTGGQLTPQALAQLQAGAAQGSADAKAALAAYQQAQPRLGADPTVQAARTNQQNALAEKWKPLNEAVSNAQTINSRLDTIKDLATRASTGQFADKQQFANSLLSLAGSEKATDAASAKALLDKNASQIVAQLGQGGLGTDAARSIISAAYPNSHMPAPAIAEAVDNLKATNSMQVAKAGVLQQHYLNNDPAGYQRAETQFNAVADPRVFQWYSMHDPQQQAAYAKRMVAQDPTFRNKVQTLTQMGALK